MASKVSAVVFEGGAPQDALDREFGRQRQMITLDSLEKLCARPEIEPVILVTNYPELGQAATALGVTVVDSAGFGRFHFGAVLAQIVREYRLQKVIYFGGASVPLLTEAELQAIITELAEREAVMIANNVQSADLIAFGPAAVLERIDLPDIDNPLGWLLHEQAGLPAVYLPNSAGMSFDVDTPGDLLFLALHPGAGHRTKASLAELKPEAERLLAAARCFAVPNAEILLAGRVGPPIMSWINQNFQCRLRVISEERGMKALGRQSRGEVRSLLGAMLLGMSPERFFAGLGEYCQAAFIDTRVVFAALRGEVSAWDRFNSDLGRYEVIKDGFVRDFTAAASSAPVPVVLGGHTAVAGGLWVLTDLLLPDGRKMG